MMTIREIADLAGCSPSTVSRVLSSKKCSIPISKKTRDKILTVCKKHDYMPNINASRFFSKQSKIVGFLIPPTGSLVGDNLSKGMSAILRTLNHNSYRILPLIADEKFLDTREYLNLFKRHEIDALVIWGAAGDLTWVDELAANNMPFVLLTNRYKDYPTVYCDDACAITQLIKHCKKKGAESFVYVTNSPGESCARRRTEFSQSAPDGTYIDCGLKISDGEEAANIILRQRPDAVICGNDRLALGIIRVLMNSGVKIPEEIMVTGADNIELVDYCPVTLTTYDQMAYKCGEVCANMVLDFLQKQKPLSSISVKPKLYIRDSA
jgi:LacI family transcriptional regulator, galactose operon repressor